MSGDFAAASLRLSAITMGMMFSTAFFFTTCLN
jgi:hypothetical protein